MQLTCSPRFLTEVDAIIHTHLHNEYFSIEDLAEALRLSTSQVYRKIKQATGLSPSVYIRTIRLGQAFELIHQTDLTLSEIAYQVGFNSLAYFSNCFSEQYESCPSSFRRKAS